MKAQLRARTVRINKVTSMKRNEQDVTVVYFTVADRAQNARKQLDGTTEYTTKGFYFCKAYGAKADFIVKHFGETDVNGKLISRAIFMEVEPQTYKKDKEVEVTLKVSADALFAGFGLPVPEGQSGRTVELKDKKIVEITETVYLVKELDFDDYKAKAVAPTEGVTVHVVGIDEVGSVDDEDIVC